jgi:hypothetical protein
VCDVWHGGCIEWGSKTQRHHSAETEEETMNANTPGRVNIIRVASNGDLYHQYPRQSNPQPCYVELDCRTGELTADYNSEIGNAVPASVYHGHTRRWAIPILGADAANELLQAIAPLAERVLAGYDSVWNGNNLVAELTPGAADAIDRIQAACEETFDDESGGLEAWEADE